MADKKEENKPIAPDVQAPPVAPDTAQPEKAASEAYDPLAQVAAPDKMSRGEKWYNRIVYQGINYWANLGISLYLTDIFAHGGGKLDFTGGKGAVFFKDSVNKLATALNHGKLSPKTAHRVASIALGTFTLNSGGNLLLIPTKYIEDNKRPLVHWLNKKLGVSQVDANGNELTPDQIFIEQEQPKQSWGRMVGRRALGFAATTSTGLIIDYGLRKKLDAPFMNEHGHEITHKNGQDVYTDFVQDKIVNKGLNAIGAKKLTVPGSTAQRYMKYAELDWIYTIITSKILHATNGANRGKQPKEIGDDDAPLVDDKSVDKLRYLTANEDRKLFAEQAAARQERNERTAALLAAKKPQESFAATVQQQNNASPERT